MALDSACSKTWREYSSVAQGLLSAGLMLDFNKVVMQRNEEVREDQGQLQPRELDQDGGKPIFTLDQLPLRIDAVPFKPSGEGPDLKADVEAATIELADKVDTAIVTAMRDHPCRWLAINEYSTPRCCKALRDNKFYGPYKLILPCGGIDGCWSSDVLGDDEVLIVQITPDVIRLVVALDPTVVQMDGGEMAVLCSLTPQLRSDYYNNIGIYHWRRG